MNNKIPHKSLNFNLKKFNYLNYKLLLFFPCPYSKK